MFIGLFIPVSLKLAMVIYGKDECSILGVLGLTTRGCFEAILGLSTSLSYGRNRA